MHGYCHCHIGVQVVHALHKGQSSDVGRLFSIYNSGFLGARPLLRQHLAQCAWSKQNTTEIEQRLSRWFDTPRHGSETKSCETSSSELIQANNFHMPINNWRSMKQISFLFSRVDGSLHLDGLGCMMCLGHLWLVDIALRCLTPWLFGRFHPEYLIRLVWIIYV